MQHLVLYTISRPNSWGRMMDVTRAALISGELPIDEYGFYAPDVIGDDDVQDITAIIDVTSLPGPISIRIGDAQQTVEFDEDGLMIGSSEPAEDNGVRDDLAITA